MIIPFNQPKRENDLFASEINHVIQTVLSSGIYILGEQCSMFEKEFSQFCQVRHCCAVANGTDALEIALRAIGVETGDEVITVANAGGYSTIACILIGAVPVYVDVDPGSLLLDLNLLPTALTPRTKCVIATHLYGQAIDISKLRTILDAAGFECVKILEDCAQSHGATINGERVGALGDIATFSFYPTKNLSALGDGGAISTSQDKLFESCQRLRQYGWTSKYNSQTLYGRNSRLDELQAAILRVKLKYLEELNAQRLLLSQKLSDLCGDNIQIVTEPRVGYVGHLFVVRHPNRDQIREKLAQHGVATDIHYPILDPDQSSMSNNYFRSMSLKHSQQATREIFSLPCYAGLSDDELNYMQQIFENEVSALI